MSVLPGSLLLAVSHSLRNLMTLKQFLGTFCSCYQSKLPSSASAFSCTYQKAHKFCQRWLHMFFVLCEVTLWNSLYFTNCTVPLCPTGNTATLGRRLSDKSRSYEVSNLGSRLCSPCAAGSWRSLLGSEAAGSGIWCCVLSQFLNNWQHFSFKRTAILWCRSEFASCLCATEDDLPYTPGLILKCRAYQKQ